MYRDLTDTQAGMEGGRPQSGESGSTGFLYEFWAQYTTSVSSIMNDALPAVRHTIYSCFHFHMRPYHIGYWASNDEIEVSRTLLNHKFDGISDQQLGHGASNTWDSYGLYDECVECRAPPKNFRKLIGMQEASYAACNMPRGGLELHRCWTRVSSEDEESVHPIVRRSNRR